MKSYGLGQLSCWQFCPGTSEMKGMTSLSTKLPNPIWKSPVMFCTAPASCALILTIVSLSSDMELDRSIR